MAREQAETLAARGHRVAVFARTREDGLADGSTWDEEIAGVLVRRVVDKDPLGLPFPATYDHHHLDAPFARFLADVEPDLVHVQHLVQLSPNLLRQARAAGIPCVLGLHDFYYLCHRIFLLDAESRRCPGPDEGRRCAPCLAGIATPAEASDRFAYMSRFVREVDVLLAPSPSLARRFLGEWPFLAGRLRVLEPGLSRLPKAHPPRRLDRSRSGEPLRLVFIGTWLPHKGLDLLIEAVLGLPAGSVHLAIHGSAVGGYEGWVDELRRRSRGAVVEWCGAFERSALDGILAAADVLVLPSRCDESYSRVVREARAAGLAVVASDAGGPADLLRDGVDGLLFPPGDGVALQQALARLAEDPALVDRLASARSAVRTVGDAVVELERVYGELCRRPSPGERSTT